jgi:preprotein translocase subunit SecY
MIQRIQSIYLLAASGVFSSFFSLPLLSSSDTSAISSVPQLADGQLNVHDNIGLLGLTILGIVLALAAIFLYRNRKLQGQISTIGVLSGVLLLVLSGVNAKMVQDALPTGGAVQYGLGWAAPVLGALFCYLAVRGIRADEAKVRSMDRLR